ncbi:glycosyltransferase family 2 protein [Agrococcus jejuensis]|uniref:Glycosyl transferase family 2 n=1 Tax=Agrococcus jejuensis TaxID=399736 RepID=A0A1G8FJB1_9MICO|nr:glycosyltransferase family 2 protein [Agrococcus jejuensis]SDH82191.1 Glycosyl transferase family 2 [Agrococcus jejuensis]
MLAMTMMVRDEADVIAATVEHHLAQGFDHLIVTDNASTDGTREILEEYAQHAPLTLHHDPEHRKQQARVVTSMAREAARMGATWVVNGDADEFVLPVDRSTTVAAVLAAMPTSLRAFTVPVVNMVGPIAETGSGIGRLRMRDERSLEALQAAGVLAHPTPNAIHVGDPEVEVAHGNHFTSIEQHGEVPDELALEVLHLPWRSATQFARKTENMGRGYEANPQLRPSANHHGMRDWRRMRAGVLLPFLALRMPTSDDLAQQGFVEDDALVTALQLDGVRPGLLAAALADGEAYDDAEIERLRALAHVLSPLDVEAQRDIVVLREEVDDRNTRLYEAQQRIQQLEIALGVAAEDGLRERIALEGAVVDARGQADRARAELAGVQQALEALEAQPVMRASRAVSRALRSR